MNHPHRSALHLVATRALAVAVALACAAPVAADPIKLKLASIAPPATPWATVMTRIKKAFSKEIPAEQLEVKTYLGGALGGEKELVQRCLSGGLGMIGVTTGAIATVVPELNVLELPYMWKNEAQVDRALAGKLGELLKAAMAAKGFELYIWSENGFRHFATRDRFIHEPKDLKGLRMRSQESSVHTDMYKVLGAAANPMPAPEVPGALSSGVVDGYDNSLLYAYATQWHTNVKFLTVSKHIYQPAAIVFCKKATDALPAEMKAKMMAQAAKLEAAGRALVRQGNAAALESHKTAGLQVQDQKNPGAFKALMGKVWDAFARSVPTGGELLAAAKAAAN